MSVKRHILSALSAFTLVFLQAKIALAQGLGTGALQEVGSAAGISKTPDEAGTQLPLIVGNLVKTLITVLGVVFLVLLVYGGFLWMTARGESTQVDKAKSTLSRAVIGLIIVISSYAIATFVIAKLVVPTTAT